MTTRTITPTTLAALALLPATAGARPAIALAVQPEGAHTAAEHPSDPCAAAPHASARQGRAQGRRGHRVAGVADHWPLYVAALIARQVER